MLKTNSIINIKQHFIIIITMKRGCILYMAVNSGIRMLLHVVLHLSTLVIE